MNQELELQTVKAAVLRFARAWTAWEKQMAKHEISLQDPAMKEAHAKLIADHFTTKKRAYVDGSLTYSDPPTYVDVVDRHIINAEFFASSKAYVDFQCRVTFYRFVVHKKREGWRIDSIKWKVVDTAEWSNGLIGM